MANEVTVVEQQNFRGHQAILEAPFLATQTLSIGGAISAAFAGGTRTIMAYTTTSCTIELTSLGGTAPDGAGAGSGAIPLFANVWLPIGVRAGDQIIAVA